MSGSEFYIGYKPKAPAQMARFLRLAVGSLILGAVVLAVVLASLQKPFDPGQFEFGIIRDFEGLLLEYPAPTLLVASPIETTSENDSYSRFLLVAPGKFGARDLVSGLQGKTIQARGTLIYRDGEAMIELVPDSIRAVAAASPQTPPFLDLGEHTLIGEIVDSKCYLGVMKPGRRKTHRACAVRCISGGIPPVLRIKSADNEVAHLLLLGMDGTPINKQILEFVGEPVEIRGTVQRLGDQLLLLIKPHTIRRLEG